MLVNLARYTIADTMYICIYTCGICSDATFMHVCIALSKSMQNRCMSKPAVEATFLELSLGLCFFSLIIHTGLFIATGRLLGTRLIKISKLQSSIVEGMQDGAVARG